MTEWNLKPNDIESRSFAIIDDEAGAHDWPAEAWNVVRRMIHTSADFEYKESVRMHADAIRAGVAAIRAGKRIVTDTRMALSGISGGKLTPFGVAADCLVDHEDVKKAAKANGTTRSVAAVDMALDSGAPGIFVIGNAPTALFRLMERVQGGAPAPDLVVGLPVGFVNAAESKAALLESNLVYVTNVGRKGGSNVAAAVVNALAVMAGQGAEGE